MNVSGLAVSRKNKVTRNTFLESFNVGNAINRILITLKAYPKISTTNGLKVHVHGKEKKISFY